MIDLVALIQQCSYGVHPETVAAIITQESQGNSLAMNIEGRSVIPKDFAEAVRIQAEAIRAGRSIDSGLMQVNSQWVKRSRIAPAQLFDGCTNIRLGTWILRSNYSTTWNRRGNKRDALIGALSMYNTGSETAGYGYVMKVVSKAGQALPNSTKITGNTVAVTRTVTPQNAPTSFPMQTKIKAPTDTDKWGK